VRLVNRAPRPAAARRPIQSNRWSPRRPPQDRAAARAAARTPAAAPENGSKITQKTALTTIPRHFRARQPGQPGRLYNRTTIPTTRAPPSALRSFLLDPEAIAHSTPDLLLFAAAKIARRR